ncbi:MAG: DUF4405 domain-containing protein [Phycisphaerales bacterium]|nr:MAG: DUF4405 domain-containing protein [Phycisphaerales bacterium]
MSRATNGKFNYRGFISVLAGFTFLAMAVTGLVMFFAPSCRIARDTGWTVWGHGKEQWAGVHVWFGTVFVVASIFHIYLNWAALVNYFKTKVQQGLAFRTEWISALVICGIIYAGTVHDVAPFSSLVAWKESFKHEGPGAGAAGQGYRGGRASLQQGQNYLGSAAAGTPGRSCELGGGQIECGSGQTLGKACESDSVCGSTCQSQNLTQPQQHASGACEQGAGQVSVASRGGFGMGQKTLQQFCADEGINLSWAINRLQSQGLTVRQAMTMREIADSIGLHPRELRGLLQHKK